MIRLPFCVRPRRPTWGWISPLLVALFASLLAASGQVASGQAPPIARAAEGAPPNVVVLRCDDLGYGDVSSLNAVSIDWE